MPIMDNSNKSTVNTSFIREIVKITNARAMNNSEKRTLYIGQYAQITSTVNILVGLVNRAVDVRLRAVTFYEINER